MAVYSEEKFYNTINRLINCSIHNTMNSLNSEGYSLEIDGIRLQIVKDEIVSHRRYMHEQMDESVELLDEHKLSAITTMLFLKHLPIRYRKKYSDTIIYDKQFNAVIAFHVGLDILIFYQIDESVPPTDVRLKVVNEISGGFSFSKEISSEAGVYHNLLFAFKSVDHSCRNIQDILWIYADIFYFVDFHGRDNSVRLAVDAFNTIKKDAS